MAICSYVVIPAAGTADRLAGRLAALPGCTVARAENRELILLVTDTRDAGEEARLRGSIEALADVRALVLTFGEIEPDAGGPGCASGRPAPTRAS